MSPMPLKTVVESVSARTRCEQQGAVTAPRRGQALRHRDRIHLRRRLHLTPANHVRYRFWNTRQYSCLMGTSGM